jgi:uncharacterized protein (UPF0179 family)
MEGRFKVVCMSVWECGKAYRVVSVLSRGAEKDAKIAAGAPR